MICRHSVICGFGHSDVQMQLGHRSLPTTMIYTHVQQALGLAASWITSHH